MHYEKHTDVELWDIFTKGNKEVLEALYKRHYDTLLNYGLACCSDKPMVEDCIQDLFVKLYVGKKITHTPSVKAYLLRGFKNTLIDKIHSSKDKQVHLADIIDFEIEVEDAALQAHFAQSDEELQFSRKLLSAFSTLSKGQKQVIYFRFVKGLTHREISYITNVNEQSVMNTLSRAITRLRKLISIFF